MAAVASRPDQEEGGNMNETLRNFKEYFECPVCYTVPRKPPIFQCTEGHLICAGCKPKLNACPICRNRWAGRLRFAERMLEKVPHSCKYSEEGCDLELLGQYIDGHEKDCMYGPISCSNLEYGCNVAILRRELKLHLENCQYIPVICQVTGCGARIGQTSYLRHIQDEHSPMSMYTQLAILMLLLSLAVHLFMFL